MQHKCYISIFSFLLGAYRTAYLMYETKLGAAAAYVADGPARK